MNLPKLEDPKTNKRKCRTRQEETIWDPIFQKNLSDMFEKNDEILSNRPENQELGPILGQNRDPDLIKPFPALLVPKNKWKIENWVNSAWKTHRKNTENCLVRVILGLFSLRLAKFHALDFPTFSVENSFRWLRLDPSSHVILTARVFSPNRRS